MKYNCNLTPELEKIARKELHEDPNRRDADIEHIRQWLLKQPHITARTDDWTILRFLRGCKFSLERTKEKLDMYYTCKAMVPEWFANRDPQDKKIREILNMGQCLPLPGYDKEGRKVIMIRPGIHNPSEISLEEVFKGSQIILEVLQAEDENLSICGVLMVINFIGFTRSHAFQMHPGLARKAMTIFQDGYPMRPKGLHYINTPPTFDAIFNMVKPLMKEKIRKRVHIHGKNTKDLHKYIPKDILPVEYGGTNGTVQEIVDYWLQKIDEKREWLLEDEKYKVDESKRPGKAKTTSDLFGLEGSFRKIDVD